VKQRRLRQNQDAVGAVTPTYDGNGNQTFDGTFTFGYDAENRLTSASGAGNTVTYAYDAEGRRKTMHHAPMPA
jgi:YD repeat-containing protein